MERSGRSQGPNQTALAPPTGWEETRTHPGAGRGRVKERGCASRGALRAATSACVPPPLPLPPPPTPPPPLGLVHLSPYRSCQSCGEFGSQRNLLSQNQGEPDGWALRPAPAWEGSPPGAVECATKVGFAVPLAFYHFFL